MFRKDGRKNEQHRNINVHRERLLEIEHGLNRVSSRIEYVSQQRVTISVKISIDKNAYPCMVSAVTAEKKEEHYAKVIEDIFKHILVEVEPSYLVTHFISCMDGSILSTLINSTSMLLEKHAIPIRHMVFSVTCTLSRYRKSEYIIDPTESEEKEKNASVILAAPYIKHKEKISFVEYVNEVPLSERVPLLEHAFQALLPISEQLISFCK